MRTSRSRYGWSLGVLAAAVLVVAGVGIVFTRGVGPITGQQNCSASVGGHTVHLGLDQARNASLISAIGVHRGLPARAVSIALATAYQESKLQNLNHGDRDSLGLFQQRPSQGWGTQAQVQDPYYATNKFYDALAKVAGFEQMRITEAAQKVQRSGYPEAYEPHAADARTLASALTGYSPGGRFSCVIRSADPETAQTAIANLERGFGNLRVVRGAHSSFSLPVSAGATGVRRGWALAQYLVAHADRLGVHRVSFAGKRWRVGSSSHDGWTTATGSRSDRVAVDLA